jgi:hypothetical protein
MLLVNPPSFLRQVSTATRDGSRKLGGDVLTITGTLQN